MRLRPRGPSAASQTPRLTAPFAAAAGATSTGSVSRSAPLLCCNGMNPPTELAAMATAAEVAASSHATTAGGAEPGAATAAPSAANPAAAAAPQPVSSSSKWHAYYASDPNSAPWDTHAASSQLQSYLCGCCSGAPVGASSSPAPGVAGPPAPAKQALSDALLHACDRCAGTKPPALVVWLAAVAAAAQGGGGPAGASDGIAGQAPPLQAMQPQQRQPQQWQPQPPRVLELCCGTGGSLAYMRSLGFHVVGVELVQAACGVAAERLAAASAPSSDTARAASGPGGNGSGSGKSSSGLVVVEAVRVADGGAAEGCAVGGCGSPSNNVAELLAAEAPASTSAARLLHGDLFAAAASGQIVPQSFDFIYDCQGLHAMPAELRPAYAGVMARALRPGGTALVLVGRREEDDEVMMAVGAATAGVTAVATAAKYAAACDMASAAAGTGAAAAAAAANGSGTTQGAASAKSASRPGPSLMSLSELRQLFPADHGCGREAGEAGGSSSSPEEGQWRWQWLGCSATRFDLTNAYKKLSAAPPAWCLLLRRC